MENVPARKFSLYDLTSDFNALMEADGEEEINDALINIVAGEIEQKAENICKLVATLEGTAEQFRAEEKRIASARKAMENKAERIRDYMKQALLSANIDKINAGTFKVSVAMTAGSVEIDDIKQIPAMYLTVVPASYVPDKAAIKEAIKAGESVPGAHIEAGTSLRIK